MNANQNTAVESEMTTAWWINSAYVPNDWRVAITDEAYAASTEAQQVTCKLASA